MRIRTYIKEKSLLSQKIKITTARIRQGDIIVEKSKLKIPADNQHNQIKGLNVSSASSTSSSLSWSHCYRVYHSGLTIIFTSALFFRTQQMRLRVSTFSFCLKKYISMHCLKKYISMP